MASHRPLRLIAALLLALAAAFAARPAAAADLVFGEGENVIRVHINNRLVRLRVDPGAPGTILLNASAAAALGLSANRGPVFTVGPVRLVGRVSIETLRIGDDQSQEDITWFDQDLVEGADGLINPAELPFDQVVFTLREPGPGEQPIYFPAIYDVQRGLHHQFAFADVLMLTRFTLLDRLSTVTAAAGAVIARRRGGAWAGPTFVHNVRFNIRRPARTMVLEEPFRLNGLTFNRLTVRIMDDPGNYRLPTELRYDEGVEENDILVLGRGRYRLPGAAHFWLMVGRDDFAHCSSLSYERDRRRIVLMCGPEAAPPPAPSQQS